MVELFLKTDEELLPIEEEIVDKYNLKNIKLSPFTRLFVVDKNGNILNYDEKATSSPGVDEMPEGEGLEDDQIVEFSLGEIMSQSEIIDFSHGTDSY